jgi:hypothetical protein
MPPHRKRTGVDWEHLFWSAMPGLAHLILSVVAIGIVVGFLTRYLYERFSFRVTVSILRRGNRSGSHAFVDLYSELIDEVDRISPERILRFLTLPGRSPRSARALRRACRKGFSSNRHLLLLAHRNRECVGFLKAVICPRAEVILLAYLGTKATGAASALIDRLHHLVVKNIRSAKFLVFEMTVDEARRHESKYRLFREYARVLHRSTFRWDEYLQPDMEFEDPENTKEEIAVLGVVRLSGQHAPLSETELRLIVPTIYRHIYGETLDDDSVAHGRYLGYLELVEKIVLEKLDRQPGPLGEVQNP